MTTDDEALSIATSNSTCAETVKIRRIVVPPSVHSTLESHGHVRSSAPMSEFIAKNVGLRHANGKFVLAQNPDDVWSPALATFLLERRDHREDTFYTAGTRLDTALPERPRTPRPRSPRSSSARTTTSASPRACTRRRGRTGPRR